MSDGHTTLNFLQNVPRTTSIYREAVNDINTEPLNKILFCCKDFEVVGCRLGRIGYIFDFSDEQKEQMKDFTLK